MVPLFFLFWGASLWGKTNKQREFPLCRVQYEYWQQDVGTWMKTSIDADMAVTPLSVACTVSQ